MPIYDYECGECRHVFDKLVLSSTVVTCPKCGSGNLQKLVSKPAPAGHSADIIRSARAQAAKEGHFSNYKASEKPRG
ncbi:MAG TPA: zinc ribbon domain-containing protein [Burkholderiales bacterium]|nr:zinc ribbon domain-containing protein [Burkholderiales bacterium]